MSFSVPPVADPSGGWGVGGSSEGAMPIRPGKDETYK